MTMKERWTNATTFVKRALQPWEIAEGEGKPGLLAKAVRVVYLLFRGYMDDDLFIHASSLTFVTMTSLVPVLTVAFAFLKGAGYGEERLQAIKSSAWLAQMPEQFQQFVEKLIEMVEGINVSALGTIGAAFFTLTAILLLANVEQSFNRVWNVRKNRSIAKQIMSYTSVLVLVPTLLILAGTLRARLVISQQFFGGAATTWLQAIYLFGLVWVAVWCLYSFVPNTTVHWKSAVFSSLVTTAAFLAWMRLFMVMSIGVAARSRIYGAFAAIPVFMFWLYVTWVILLLGVELAYALQNADSYYLEGNAADTASLRTRVLVALMMVREAGQVQAEERRTRFNPAAFSTRYRVPIRLVRSVLDVLVQIGYFVKDEDSDSGFVVNCRLDKVPVHDFVKTFTSFGGIPKVLEDGLASKTDCGRLLTRMENDVARGLGGCTLADLCDSRLPAAK